jgi:predicted transcriptional regulator
VNISARIRRLISHAMTAAEIHELMPDIDVKMIRGCIQPMVASGVMHRVGDKKPYKYQLGRGLEIHNRGRNLNITQQVRACIRHNGPISADRIQIETGIKMKDVRSRISEMKKRKFVIQDENGLYSIGRELSCKPSQRTEEDKRLANLEAQRKRRNRDRALRESKRPKESTPMTIVKVKEKGEPKAMKAQTVDEWLAQGGVIDRSPTPLPFERLSRADIDMSYRAASTVMARTARSYLAG